MIKNSTTRIVFLSLLIFASNLALCANTKYVEEAINVDLSDGIITVNGKELERPITIDQYESALGAADKVFKLANTIHTYHTKGIILYQTPNKEEVLAFTMFFGKEDFKFMPKKLFSGKLTINEVSISSEMKEAEFAELLPQYEFEEKYGYKRGEYMGMYVYVNYDRKRGTLKSINIGYNNDED